MVVEEEVGGGRSSARRTVSVAYCQRRGHAVLLAVPVDRGQAATRSTIMRVAGRGVFGDGAGRGRCLRRGCWHK